MIRHTETFAINPDAGVTHLTETCPLCHSILDNAHVTFTHMEDNGEPHRLGVGSIEPAGDGGHSTR